MSAPVSITQIVIMQFSSVAHSCPTLWNPMDWSTPGLPVHHQFPDFTQTHVHWISDAIKPSHPLSSPSPLAFSLSHHQSLFKMSKFFASGSQSIRVSASASVFPINIQDWFPLELMGLISLLSQESSLAPQFKSIHSSAFSILYCPTLTSVRD